MTPFLVDADCTLWHGDVLDVLRELPSGSVDCVVTSPPYWGLRDYGTGMWEGGDEVCDHLPQRGKYADGCSGCGVPMSQSTQGCAHCADRLAKRELRGTPDKDYTPYDPNRGDLPNPPASWAKRDATVGSLNECSRCGARRVDQQLGLEPTPDQYVQRMVAVFREVRRVLAEHGTCWVNLGDSYANDGKWGGSTGGKHVEALHGAAGGLGRDKRITGLKPKDLVGIPWRVAFALQADGWWLRSDIVWAKPNPMPESVTDRPTKAHEYVFLLTKQPKYYFDQEAVREPAEWQRWGDQTNGKHEGSGSAATWIGDNKKVDLSGKPAPQEETLDGSKSRPSKGRSGVSRDDYEAVRPGGELTRERIPMRGRQFDPRGRNIRSVWSIATQPYPEAHFATYPEELVRRCVLAGCPVRVCRTCGKASERVISATAPDGRTAVMRGGKAYDENGEPLMGDNMIDHGVRGSWNSGGEVLRRETLGWSDCGHNNNWRPGRVLDPFVGSGTTCKVARDHGRHSVGIDLNADYLKLAAKRLAQQSLLSEPAA